MQSALEQFTTQGSSLKMTTGSSELDSLIDSIEEGILYLLYGDPIPLETLSHRLLVNCILPVKLQHGFESMALCFNNTDYYSRKLILNPERIANIAKSANIDPITVSKNLYIQTAYTYKHQLQVAEEICSLIGNNDDIKLVIINNMTKFFADARSESKLEVANYLKQAIAITYKACAKNRITLVVTGQANQSSKGIIPRPIGGSFLKHIANVIIHLRDISASNFDPRFKATLVKHMYMKTPKSIIIHGKKCGRGVLI
jgi:RecA/RadA recombinase